MPDQHSNKLVEKPPWLDDYPNIKAFLLIVLKKYESKGMLKYKITKKSLPDLFGSSETAETTWILVQDLCKGEKKIFDFNPSEDRISLDHPYLNGKLYFLFNTEYLLRYWLGIPSKKSKLEAWRLVVEENKENFKGDTSKLSEKLFSVTGYSDEEVISKFVKIKEYLNAELTLRNLSACCFWQDSKFLDGREDLVIALHPGIRIITRPVLVNVFLPEEIEGILFIENQDNYTQGIKAVGGISNKMKKLALVFSYGNKLSADRVRTKDGVSFHYDDTSISVHKEAFEEFWFRNSKDWSVYFWGDLDNSGMDILLNLKKNFCAIEAWQPGYEPMLKLLENNGGHSALQSGKQNQKMPLITGCSYTDNILLPALKKHKRFIDQECIL